MRIKKGLVFTGGPHAFQGRVEVLEVKEETEELRVWLTSPIKGTTRFSEWEETWDLEAVHMGFDMGEYRLPKHNEFGFWPELQLSEGYQ